MVPRNKITRRIIIRAFQNNSDPHFEAAALTPSAPGNQDKDEGSGEKSWLTEAELKPSRRGTINVKGALPRDGKSTRSTEHLKSHRSIPIVH